MAVGQYTRSAFVHDGTVRTGAVKSTRVTTSADSKISFSYVRSVGRECLQFHSISDGQMSRPPPTRGDKHLMGMRFSHLPAVYDVLMALACSGYPSSPIHQLWQSNAFNK